MNKHKVFMLIDDDEDDREIFRMAVEALPAGSSCVTCKSGQDALDFLQRKHIVPSYILIDINMPVMNGKDVLGAIRNLEHVRDVPIFMYSTSSERQDRNDFIEMGAREMLTKPPKLSMLVSLLENLPD